MIGRATSMPQIAVKAGVMAAFAFGPVAGKETLASSRDNATIGVSASATNWRGRDLASPDGSCAGATLSFPVAEEWSEEKHSMELRKLIVKRATSKSGLSSKDATRLADLQRMRRESLPLAVPYEEFIRERERNAELLRLTNELLAYARKYGTGANG